MPRLITTNSPPASGTFTRCPKCLSWSSSPAVPLPPGRCGTLPQAPAPGGVRVFPGSHTARRTPLHHPSAARHPGASRSHPRRGDALALSVCAPLGAAAGLLTVDGIGIAPGTLRLRMPHSTTGRRFGPPHDAGSCRDVCPGQPPGTSAHAADRVQPARDEAQGGRQR